MKTLLAMFAISCSAAPAVAQVVDERNPGSLWPKNYVNPLWDRTAKEVGDVVTILISETSLASFAASTKAEKSVDNSIQKGVGPILRNLIPALQTGASSTVDGKGATTQTGRLVARMTAIVKKIMPGGTMLIEGTRSVQVNKEIQTFRVSGIIRRDDIRADNTVLSESIAEAAIHVDGKGMISDRQKRGIITRILDWLF